MHLPETDLAGRAFRVGIGESEIARPPRCVRVTLGSCVGVCLYWPEQNVYGVAHVLLPSPKHGLEAEGEKRSRYGSTAVPYLLEQLAVPASARRKLEVFVAGGASMYADEQQQNTGVGRLNVETVLESIKRSRLRVRREDIGGVSGRQLVVDGEGMRVLSMHLDDSGRIERWNLRQASA